MQSGAFQCGEGPGESSFFKRHFARRSFIALAAAGLLTACQAGTSGQAPDATKTPTPTRPLQVITAQNAKRLAHVGQFDPNHGRVRSLAWAQDGRTLVVGAAGALQVWDALAGRMLKELHGRTGQIYGLNLSPDGSALVSGGDDGMAKLWDTHTWTLTSTLVQSPKNTIFSSAWSPDSRRLALGYDDGTVQLWDLQAHSSSKLEGAVSGRVQGGSIHYPFAVYGLSWSPDGHRLASPRYDGVVFIWQVATGKKLATLHTSSLPNAVGFAPDGKLLASTSDDGTVQLWTTTSYKNSATLRGPSSSGWIYPMNWSPDGTLLAAGNEDGLVQVWDVASTNRLAALSASDAAVWGLSWSRDGKLLASGSDDGVVQLWGVR